jgi:hypothetical protein
VQDAVPPSFCKETRKILYVWKKSWEIIWLSQIFCLLLQRERETTTQSPPDWIVHLGNLATKSLWLQEVV